MTVRMEELSNPTNADWSSIIQDLPGAHILQSGQWADIKRANQWIPQYLVWKASEGNILAAACLHLKTIPIISRISKACLLYAPRGPILDWTNQELVRQVFDDLERYATQQGAFFLKIDPDVPIAWGVDAVINPVGAAVKNHLSTRKWIYSQDQLQFRNTILVDLTLPMDALLERMKQKTRYNIRLAERKGVTIRIGVSADLLDLFRMYAETADRDGFIIRTREYYLDVWQRLMMDDMAMPLIAEVQGEPIAALILFRFAKRAYYFYGMSTGKFRDWMPNHLLQWHAIQYAKSHGCDVYDFWGAPDKLDKSDPMYGVFKFKDGFNGRLVHGLGAWDYLARPGWYRFYTKTMPFILDWMRRVARKRVKKEAQA